MHLVRSMVRIAAVLPMITSLMFGALVHNAVPHSHASPHDLAEMFVSPPSERTLLVEADVHVHSPTQQEHSESVAWQMLHASLTHHDKKTANAEIPAGMRSLRLDADRVLRSDARRSAWYIDPEDPIARFSDPDAGQFLSDGIRKDRRFS